MADKVCKKTAPLRAAVFFAILEKPQGGCSNTPPPSRARVKALLRFPLLKLHSSQFLISFHCPPAKFRCHTVTCPFPYQRIHWGQGGRAAAITDPKLAVARKNRHISSHRRQISSLLSKDCVKLFSLVGIRIRYKTGFRKFVKHLENQPHLSHF